MKRAVNRRRKKGEIIVNQLCSRAFAKNQSKQIAWILGQDGMCEGERVYLRAELLGHGGALCDHLGAEKKEENMDTFK